MCYMISTNLWHFNLKKKITGPGPVAMITDVTTSTRPSLCPRSISRFPPHFHTACSACSVTIVEGPSVHSAPSSASLDLPSHSHPTVNHTRQLGSASAAGCFVISRPATQRGKVEISIELRRVACMDRFS